MLPEAADGLKATARDNLAWLDKLLAGKTWIVGDRFTVADIILYCALDFGRGVGQPVDPATWQRDRVVRARRRAPERGGEPPSAVGDVGSAG